MIHKAVKEKHPEVTVIGTVGPFHSGTDFEAGWNIANTLRLEMVDEHYYEKPEWFLNNRQRYDNYDRSKARVYVGEYAAHDKDRVNTWRSALAEAVYLTALERNGDIVHLASYAPLLARQGHTQWRPDLIYFDKSALLLTANYYVQQMFGQNQGDRYWPAVVDSAASGPAISCVQDSASGDVILKLVNVSDSAVGAKVNLEAIGNIQPAASRILLTAKPDDNNTFANPRAVVPQVGHFDAASSFTCDLPPSSFTLIRFKTR
jgi:alpha-L-arabinofuranosidase